MRKEVKRVVRALELLAYYGAVKSTWEHDVHIDNGGHVWVIAHTWHKLDGVESLLNKLGAKTAWYESVAICDDCGYVIDRYGHEPCWIDYEAGDISCASCVASEHEEEYLEHATENPEFCVQKCMAPNLESSFELLNTYCVGWDGFSSETPASVAKKLEGLGYSGWVFVLDDVRQFGSTFSVWVPKGAKGMLEAYLACALWSSTDEDDKPLDDSYTTEDFSEETIVQSRKDCIGFLLANRDEIGDRYERAGSDLWLTRNRHGAGFWDGEEGDALTDAAHAYGSVDLHVSDGKVH